MKLKTVDGKNLNGSTERSKNWQGARTDEKQHSIYVIGISQREKRVEKK